MKKITILLFLCSSCSILAMGRFSPKTFQQRKRDIPCALSFIANTDNKAVRYCVFAKLLYGNKDNFISSADIIDLAPNLLQDKPRNKDHVSGVFYLMENLNKTKKNYLVLKITIMLDSLVFIKRCLANF